MTVLRRRAVASVALGIAIATGAGLAVADDVDLSGAGITSVEGLAYDPADQELFVLSGTDITVLSPEGKKLGDVTHPADLQDAQALAYREGYLFIGDLGDRQLDRDFVTVYRMQADAGQRNYRAWDFRYPDGEANARALLVSGKGRFYIVTDGSNPGVYRASAEPSRQGVNDLERVADAPNGVTDGVFLADGTTMALRTPEGIQLLDALTWETTATTTYVGAPAEESITTFGQDRLLVGGAAGLRDETVPSGNTTATPVPASTSPSASQPASASASPTPSTSPSPSASGTVAPDDGPTTSVVSRQGTLMAVGAAVVVALLAGAFVFIVRD